ncbi:putative UDP-N-acetylglucosamine 2-epimerase [Tepidanaerobacter syntrophicus]|uniref:non-hydrolyzing UDP-N-acetylglucosamine 2-epimerase n=1 Tax=Tepidanaerobacter syntrophicus TaxID=224999 RepID=UPI001775530E|nr:UDP-N-acetylglucosamine 2-epimerase (non-hydrolyzing) [Tepidanaerobacter syntrophicus]GLI19511.1 putative UDP-N-acetylglucosamine 2-epimerase [Tepidanaerobacter syntrophicus]HHV82900.1 UDP-N-acetylglucosamine 2-epimerase (non-hydrolyzing) [Tepidanaerobacter syntrophicus]
MNKIKILIIFGTRPEAIKMAPLVQELKKRNNFFDCTIAVTAQHREMLDQVLSLFNIRADHDLNIMTDKQTLFGITTTALLGLGEVLDKTKPDMVIVHGDTTTTFAGALAAFYYKVKVGHVEAGLRTHNKWLPFPEEMNRKLTGSLADIHFSPTETAKKNLLKEGVNPENIIVTGNTVIDALQTTVKKNFVFSTAALNDIDYTKEKVVLVTAHRRENLGKPLDDICHGLKKLADDFDDIKIVYPVHLNPAVQNTVFDVLDNHERILLLNPLDTDEMHNLMARSYMVITDSGGLQEEAPSLGKPVLVLRNETERPEAVDAGTVKVIGTEINTIYKEAARLLTDKDEYGKMANSVNPYGDGCASRRIADFLLYYFGITKSKPEEFRS